MATALVTGGTAGIGAAFARAFAARGDDLVLVARDAERLAAMAADLQAEYGVAVEAIAADLAVRADVSRVAERLTSDAQPVDTLVNNAGAGVRAKLTAADPTPHEQALDLMVRAVMLLGGAAGRTMRARGRGTIINVSSTAGFVAMGGYSAIKAWVTAYSEGLAVELAGSGVQVTALCPGFVRTESRSRAEIITRRVPAPPWLAADEVVAASLSDISRRKAVSRPPRRYSARMFLFRQGRRSGVRAASTRLSSGRH